MMSTEDKDDDEIGYGKPPKKCQFKKGQSGNPKGRPRKEEKASSFVQMVDEYMNGKVPISSNGKSKKVPRLKVFIMTVFRDAMNGDPRARRQLMDLIKLAGLLDPTAVAQPLSHLVVRELLPNELKLAMLALQQAPFRDGHKPPLSDEILERYGLLFPDDE